MSFSSLLGLKKGIFLAGTSTRSPVLGLRPTRGLRCRVRKLPKPRISILSPARSERTTLSKIVSTMTSLSLRVNSARRDTSSIKSALVIGFAPARSLRPAQLGYSQISGKVGKSKLLLHFRAAPSTDRLFPQVIEAGVGLHQLGRVGQVLGNVSKQQIQHALAVFFRPHDGRLALDSNRLGRVFDGRAEVANLVNQLKRHRLLARPDLAVRQGLDFLHLHAPTRRHRLDELSVHVVDQPLHVFALGGSHGPYRRAGVLEFAGLKHNGLELGPLQQFFVVVPLRDDADGTDNRGVVCKNLVGRRRNVVCAAGSYGLDGGHDALLLDVAYAQYLAINLLRCGRAAAGRIHMNDDGLDGAVIPILA